MNTTPWGWHLLIDCKDCDPCAVTDPRHIKNFVKDLVKAIDMVPYGDTVVKHFAEHDPEKAGYSMTQLIETSLISAHFVDISGDAYIDVFSCKEFDVQTVCNLVIEYFDPLTMTHKMILRGE